MITFILSILYFISFGGIDMIINITKFLLYVVMIFGFFHYLYIAVFEILIHNKFLYGKYFPKEVDYCEFVIRNSRNNDVFNKR